MSLSDTLAKVFSVEAMTAHGGLYADMDDNFTMTADQIAAMPELASFSASAADVLAAAADADGIVPNTDAGTVSIAPGRLERKTLQLREVPEDATEQAIAALFSEHGLESPESIGRMAKFPKVWSVDMPSQAGAAAAAKALRGAKLGEAKLSVRVKNNALTTLARAPVRPVGMPGMATLPVGRGSTALFDPSAAVNAQQRWQFDMSTMGAPPFPGAGAMPAAAMMTSAFPASFKPPAGVAPATAAAAAEAAGAKQAGTAPAAGGAKPAPTGLASMRDRSDSLLSTTSSLSSFGWGDMAMAAEAVMSGRPSVGSFSAAQTGGPSGGYDGEFTSYSQAELQRIIKAIPSERVAPLPAGLQGEQFSAIITEQANTSLVNRQRTESMDAAVRKGRPRFESVDSIQSVEVRGLMGSSRASFSGRAGSAKASTPSGHAGKGGKAGGKSKPSQGNGGKQQGSQPAAKTASAPAPAKRAAAGKSAPAPAPAPAPSKRGWEKPGVSAADAARRAALAAKASSAASPPAAGDKAGNTKGARAPAAPTTDKAAAPAPAPAPVKKMAWAAAVKRA